MKEIYNQTPKNKLLKIQIIVILSSLMLGTLLHFTYEWSGKNVIVASFSASNESTWEHLKLAFYPIFLATIIEYSFVKNVANNYIEAKTIGIVTAISFIVISFFTYTGILGIHLFLIDILIFVVSVILGECVAYKLMKREDGSNIKTKLLAVAIMAFLLISFIVCTYTPPEINLFRDPLTGNYGIE